MQPPSHEGLENVINGEQMVWTFNRFIGLLTALISATGSFGAFNVACKLHFLAIKEEQERRKGRAE